MSKVYTYDIYTKNGIKKDKIFPKMNVLHLGCGKSKLNGAIGIDKLVLENVDIVHDLDKTPWPVKEKSVDIIFAHSFLEHIDDVILFFNECYRVGKDGTRVIVTVPYFRCIDAYSDPTHKHFFTSQSLNYLLDEENDTSNYQYTNNKFNKIGFWYGWPSKSNNFLKRIFKNFIHSHVKFYDQYLSLLFPVKILVWELEIRNDK